MNQGESDVFSRKCNGKKLTLDTRPPIEPMAYKILPWYFEDQEVVVWKENDDSPTETLGSRWKAVALPLIATFVPIIAVFCPLKW